MEKYKFTSVVAQDLLDSFLSFFPELKEQSVDCRAGEAHCLPYVCGQLALSPPGEQRGWQRDLLHRLRLLPRERPLQFSCPSFSRMVYEPHTGTPWVRRGACASYPVGAQEASLRRHLLGQAD